VKTISFPSISTGIYGYPLNEAAKIAVQTVANWLRDHPGAIHTVKLVQFSAGDHQTYRQHAENLRFGLAVSSHG
jgi:O-acetyl-ADP-ribose deacetylase (regulator of RNase III)